MWARFGFAEQNCQALCHQFGSSVFEGIGNVVHLFDGNA
jgi:hypothetical protein